MLPYAQGYFDEPNITGDPNFNVINNKPISNDANNFQVRGDHVFSDSDRIWGRFNIIDGNDVTPVTLKINTIGNFTNFTNMGGGWFHSFSPNVVMDHSFGYSAQPYVQGTVPIAEIGDAPAIAGGFGSNPDINTIPKISIGTPGFDPSRPGTLPGIEGPLVFEYQQFHYSGNLTWIKGNHTMKVGFQYLRHTLDPVGLGAQGFDFVSEPTASPAAIGTTGDALATMLLGTPSVSSGGLASPSHLAYPTMGLYFQDSWRIKPNVTINYGLRFDHLFYPQLDLSPGNLKSSYDLADGSYLIGADTLPPPCNQAGVAPCIPGDGLQDVPFGDRIRLADYPSVGPKPVFDNFQPRIGIAWSVKPQTVIRGGYGIVFDQLTGVNQTWQGTGGWPTNQSFSRTANGLGDPVEFVEDLRGQVGSPLPGAAPWGETCWCADPNIKNPFSHQWNLEVRQQMANNLVVSLGYVGSKSHRLQITGLGNTATTAGPGTPDEVQLRKPFPYITTLFYGTDRGTSTYNAFEAKAERRFSNGLLFLASYTWSKASDNGASGFFGPENGVGDSSVFQNFYDTKSSRGPSGFNIPHFFSFSTLYELPFGKGKSMFNEGPASWILGDWSVNSIVIARSGQPINLIAEGDVANIGNEVAWWSYARPNLVGDPASGGGTAQQWYNPNAFEVPQFSYGNTPRGLLTSDGVFNVDFSLFRRFPFGAERRRSVEFRAEFFNIFNMVNYAAPIPIINSPAAGRITSVAPNSPVRQIQFALRLTL